MARVADFAESHAPAIPHAFPACGRLVVLAALHVELRVSRYERLRLVLSMIGWAKSRVSICRATQATTTSASVVAVGS
jgi:hypothetical protein